MTGKGASWSYLFALIACALIIVSTLPGFFALYSQPSFITSYEEGAAQWIANSTSRDAAIVSDPVTMADLSGLANRVPLVQPAQNAPFGLSPADQQRLIVIQKMFLTNDPYVVYQDLQELESMGISTEQYERAFVPVNLSNYLILLDTRTSNWLDAGGGYPIWYPSGQVEQKYLNKFLDARLFQILYSYQDELYLIRLKLPVGIETEDVLNLTATFQSDSTPTKANNYLYVSIASPDYRVQPGDELIYDILISPTNPQPRGGLDLAFENGTHLRDTGVTDQNNITSHPANILLDAVGQWYHREIKLGSLSGGIVTHIEIAIETTLPGSYSIAVFGIEIVGGNGTHEIAITPSEAIANQSVDADRGVISFTLATTPVQIGEWLNG